MADEVGRARVAAPGGVPAMLLEQDAFLNRLTSILQKSRGTGTIYVTFKRCACLPAKAHSAIIFPQACVMCPPAGLTSRAGIPGVKTADKATPEQLANVGCLVRATGAHQKISCMITAKEQKRFMQSYGNILKISLDSLKKIEKKKKAVVGKSTKNLVPKGK